MKLSKEQAREFIWSKTSPDVLGVEREAITDDGSGRWQSHHTLVLKDTAGRYWAASYSRGLTEMQDGSPFEDDPDEIEFHQVAKVPVLTYEYKGMGLEGGDSEPAGDSPDSPATPESRVPGPGAKPGTIEFAGDDPADLWPNILRVEPDEIIKAAL